MGLFSGLGKLAGGLVGGLFGKKGSAIGEEIGGGLGDLVSLKTGGRVPGNRNKAVPAMLHGNEYVLPAGVAPTKSQKKAVAKRKANAKKR